IRPSRAVLLTEFRNLGLQPLNIIRQARTIRRSILNRSISLHRLRLLNGLFNNSVVFRHDDPLDQSGVGLLALGNLVARIQRTTEGVQLVALTLRGLAIQLLRITNMCRRLIDRAKQRLNRATTIIVKLELALTDELHIRPRTGGLLALVNRATRRQHQTKRTRTRPRHTSPPTRLPISLNRLNQL